MTEFRVTSPAQDINERHIGSRLWLRFLGALAIFQRFAVDQPKAQIARWRA